MDHQNVPAGTLHEQDRNGPVTLFRDYDTLLVGGWRLDIANARRLRDYVNGALLDMTLARREIEEQAREAEALLRGAAVPGQED